MGDPGISPQVGKIPWRRERLPTPVFWPGEFNGLYSPWGCKESDTTEQLSLFCFMRCVFNCVALRGPHLYARGSVIQLASFRRPKALTPAPPLHPTQFCVSLEIRAPPLKQLVTLLLASSVDSPACSQDPGFPVLSDKLIHPF